MYCISKVTALSFLILFILTSSISASINNGAETSLKIRAAHHTNYLRIVIEGPEQIVAKGKITKQSKGIQVSFPDENISINKIDLPFKYKHHKNTISFSIDKADKYKYFLLKNPDRLVIDVLNSVRIKKTVVTKVNKIKNDKTKNTEQKKVTQKKPLKEKKIKEKDMLAEKHEETETAVEQPDISPKIKTVNTKSNISVKEDDYSYIPNEYGSVTDLMIEGKYFEALKELKNYETDGVESIAIYHFLYGESYFQLQQFSKSTIYFRISYIFASNDELREVSLLKRAEAYQESRLFQEAKGYYNMFIDRFPSSKYIEKVHLNLAKILTEIGIYVEAAEHFGKGGEESEAMFGMARALHKLDMIDDAKMVYDDAMLADKKYPERFPEAYYFMGENMRKAGNLDEAKKYLLLVQYGQYKNKANISLGLIDMEQSKNKQAVSKFRTASMSRDKIEQAISLFHLSKAYMNDGNLEKAIMTLEKMRLEYFDFALYKDCILELSRLYRKAGRTRDSLSLIKELVYTKDPPVEVFDDIEQILLESVEYAGKEKENEVKLVELWKELEIWVTEKTREKFLLKISRGLRHEGEPFLKLATWLVKNTSRSVRVQAAVDLADYYVETGHIKTAKMYMEVADESFTKRDSSIRVEVKLELVDGKTQSAFKRLKGIKEFKPNDFNILVKIIKALKDEKSNKEDEAIAYFEKLLAKGEWSAKNYIMIADFFNEKGQKNKALKYYRIAYKKDPENQWVAYRISKEAASKESKEIYGRLQQGNTLFGRIAKSKLMEISLMNKVQEVY